MKHYSNLLIPLFFYFIILPTANGQSYDSSMVRTEIEKAALAEQNAFKEGDCDKVLDYMDDEITFLANGRRAPSKMMIGKFCTTIPRPCESPTVDKLEIHPISETTGYVIRNIEYPKDEKTKISEYVTKIWKKTDGKWRITHLHSTVKEMPLK